MVVQLTNLRDYIALAYQVWRRFPIVCQDGVESIKKPLPESAKITSYVRQLWTIYVDMNANGSRPLIFFASALHFIFANGRIVDPYAHRFLQLKGIVGTAARLMPLQSINEKLRGQSFGRPLRGSRRKILSVVQQARVPLNRCIRSRGCLGCMTCPTSSSTVAGGGPSTPSLSLLRLRPSFWHPSQVQVLKFVCWRRHEL